MSDEERQPPATAEEVAWPDAEQPPTVEEQRSASALAHALALDLRPAEAAVAVLWSRAEMLRASTESRSLHGGERLLEQVMRARPVRRRRPVPLLAPVAAVVLLIGALVVVRWQLMQEPAAPSLEARRLVVLAWSRPSNDLLGEPIRDRAGARERLDRVFADRLSGYRVVRLALYSGGER